MTVAELMLAGAELMALGMGIVFSFLVVLVFTLRGMSRLANLLDGRQPAATATGPALPGGASPDAVPDDDLVAVISAAIVQYRARRPR